MAINNKKYISKINAKILLTATLSLFISSNSHADDLLTIYNKATKTDPKLLQAYAKYEATKQNVPIAIAELLPKLTLSAGIIKYKLLDYGNNPSVTSKYFSLDLDQVLFDWDKIQRYYQADLEAQKAIYDLAIAKEDLFTRVSDAYFGILEAKDKLLYASSEKSAVNRLLADAQEKFKVGYITVADLDEIKARHDVKTSEEIAAKNSELNAFDTLAEIIGEPVSSVNIISAKFKPSNPLPNNIEKWVKMAQNRNHTLISEQLQYQIKEKDEDRAFAGYLPTLKANIGYRGVDSNNSIFIDEVSTANGYLSSYSRSIDGTWELFSSGGTMARVSQAKHNARAELFNVEKIRRDIVSNTRQSYRNILSSINQIRALEQAEISGISALEATKAGYDIGTKVSTDVLNRLSDLYRQKQELATAKYLYIKNIIKIKTYSGILTNGDAAIINTWLTSDVAVKSQAKDSITQHVAVGDKTIKAITKPLKKPELAKKAANQSSKKPEQLKPIAIKPVVSKHKHTDIKISPKKESLFKHSARKRAAINKVIERQVLSKELETKNTKIKKVQKTPAEPVLVVNTPKTLVAPGTKPDDTEAIINSLPEITINKQDNLDVLEEKLQKVIKKNKK